MQQQQVLKTAHLLRILSLAVVLCLTATSSRADSNSSDQELLRRITDHIAGFYKETLTDSFEPGSLSVSLEQIPTLSSVRPPCSHPFKIENTAELPVGRENIKIWCRDPEWKLYIPVTVHYFRDMVYLTEAVNRNDIISEASIELRKTDISTQLRGYYTGLSDVTGMVARRNLTPGTILNAKLLKAPTLIERGDGVIIMAANSAIEVSMPGIALRSGEQGKQIPVRNLKTEEVIRAVIVQKGVVEVRF